MQYNVNVQLILFSIFYFFFLFSYIHMVNKYPKIDIIFCSQKFFENFANLIFYVYNCMQSIFTLHPFFVTTE